MPSEFYRVTSRVKEGTAGHSSKDSSQEELASLYALRPQTLAFSLCDSPVGLLAGILDIVHTRLPSDSPPTSRSRSPFLSPSELELQDGRPTNTDNGIDQVSERREQPLSPQDTGNHIRSYSWTPTEILNWTMLTWLPGPEASLRWLRRATFESRPTSDLSTAYCSVPLGISGFQARGSSSANTPLMWGATCWDITWVKRHQRPALVSPAWEAPDMLVLDMRECFGTFVSKGAINLPVQES